MRLVPPRTACRCTTIAVAALLGLAAACSHTPPFRDAAGKLLAGGIAEQRVITINRSEQSVLLRGASRELPLLVLLHGGPGASETALFRAYVPELERHFLMVYWDQRGSGRSFQRDLSADAMTLDQFVADLNVLIATLTAEFDRQGVYLLGHSWGTLVGLEFARRHPRRVIAYAGVGQVADFPEAERLGWQWALDQASAAGDSRAVQQLEGIGAPPHDVAAMLVERKWVEAFGGAFHQDLSTGSLIWRALGTPEATLWDLYLFGRGNRYSLNRIWPWLRNASLRDATRFEVPIFFLLGRYDMQVPAPVAADYFGTLQAPCKSLIWFEQSAHNPPFEEPERFVEVMAGLPKRIADGPCRSDAAGSGGAGLREVLGAGILNRRPPARSD